MPITPDRNPGQSFQDDGLLIESGATSPTVNGEIRYRTGVGFQFFEEGVSKSLTGTGLSESAHKALLQLVHFIDEGPAEGFASGATKTITGTVFPSQILWKRADATKLVEQNITWTGASPTTIQWKVYDVDGTTVLATITDTITYSGPFEASRVRAIA